CSFLEIQRYSRKLSGPLMDRIDLHLQVPRPTYDEITGRSKGENSETIRERVTRAREIQNQRYKNQGIYYNSQMKPAHIKKYCSLDHQSQNILKQAFNAFKLSGRSYHRLLKVSRTIADLKHSDDIKTEHLAEALQYRTSEKENFFC
ncbi:MAG: magnesium chelatase, partial [Firmicutes bacterium HGW-Firmicutes-13]